IKNDNLDLAKIQGIYVIEKFRNQGIGRKLLEEFVNSLPSQISKFASWAIKDTEGQNFLENLLDEKPKHKVRQSVSEIRYFDKNEVVKKSAELRAEAEKNGFQIIYIGDAQFETRVNLSKYIPAYQSIFDDTPLEELTWERELFTEEKFLEKYKSHLVLGYNYHTFVALKGDEVAGMTDVQINNMQPLVAEQLITGVIRNFRGNKLGLTLKYQMLEKLITDTDVKYWETDNAGSNEHMIRINNELGFKEWLIGYMYETQLSDLQLNKTN
ncbi:MAG: GNAT family N-acetyltransferase, partial [Candidatus Kariarchaeaceae archaeon]